VAEEHTLRLKVDSTQIKKAEGDLNGLTNASGRAEKSTTGLTTSFFSLGRVLSATALLGTAAQFVKMADTMTGVESKLKLVTKNTLDLTTAQQSLFEIAQKTRQGYAETVDTFSNFALAMGDMGKSQNDILRVTETVNKAIAISGGTAQQAAAATMQLGQAFASGTLRGDELNSILENSKGLAQAIADGMGVPIGQLRTLGSEGKITAEILATALEKSAQSVDEKFGKVGVTVSASLTTVHNALLDMIGTTNSATGATEGLAEMFTYLGTSITDNKADIVEFGKDILRTLQLSGTGVMLLGVEVASFFNNIPYAVTLSIDTLVAKIEQMINDVLAQTEIAVNKVKGLVGGDKVSLGRVDISTNLSKDYASSAKYLANLSTDLITTSNKLTKDIAGMTTVVSKAGSPSDKAGAKKGGAKAETPEQKEAREKAEREAQKAAEEEAKIQKGYLDSYAELQANAAIEEYNNKITYLEAYADIEAKTAIDAYNKEVELEKSRIESSAEMYQIMNELSGNWYANEVINISNRAAAFAAAGQSDIDVLSYVAQATQAIDTRLAIESIDEMNSGLEDTKDLLSGFNDFGANLDGVAGSIGNVAKTIADMHNNSQKFIQKDIDSQKKYAKSFLKANGDIDKEKQAQFEFDKDVAKNKEEQFNAEMAGYASLAGSMASAFEKGSAGAIAFTALQSALGIASSWTAIAGAWALPFPSNIPAVAAVTSAVLPIIGQLGGSASSGGSAKKGPDYSSTIQSASFADNKGVSIRDYGGNFDKFIKGLDSASAKLEGFGSTGSALGERLRALTNSINVKAIEYESWLMKAIGWTKPINIEAYVYSSLKNGNERTGFGSSYAKAIYDMGQQISSILTEAVQESLDYSLLTKEALSSLVSDIDLDAYEETLNQINELALKAKAQGGVLSDADKETLIELYTLPNFIKAQDYQDAIDIYTDYIEDEKDLTLDRLDGLGSFIDSATDFVKELRGVGDSKQTFSSFATSFSDMINAIQSGSEDIDSIGGKAIDAAKVYLDTVSATATTAKDIEFSKLLVASRFASIGGVTEISLSNINDTLVSNLGRDSEIVAKLTEVSNQLRDLNAVNITQASTQINTLTAIRATL